MCGVQRPKGVCWTTLTAAHSQRQMQQAARVVAAELAFSDLNHRCEIYTAERADAADMCCRK